MAEKFLDALYAFSASFDKQGHLSRHDTIVLDNGLSRINPDVIAYLYMKFKRLHEFQESIECEIPEEHLKFIETEFGIPRSWVINKRMRNEPIKRIKCENRSCIYKPCAYSHTIKFRDKIIEESAIWSLFPWNCKKTIQDLPMHCNTKKIQPEKHVDLRNK